MAPSLGRFKPEQKPDKLFLFLSLHPVEKNAFPTDNLYSGCIVIVFCVACILVMYYTNKIKFKATENLGLDATKTIYMVQTSLLSYGD